MVHAMLRSLHASWKPRQYLSEAAWLGRRARLAVGPPMTYWGADGKLKGCEPGFVVKQLLLNCCCYSCLLFWF